MKGSKWYALVGTEVVGPFETGDRWYHSNAGPDWRGRQIRDGRPDPWQVDFTELGETTVSTVFLGLDHSWTEGAAPLVFETLVFPDLEDVWRCSTWDEAVAQHQYVLDQVRQDR